jgi:Ca-activated chloride channel family protein
MAGALLALLAGPLPAAAAELAGQPAVSGVNSARVDGNSSLVMVLDSSGSMAEDDGSGATRMESARKAVGTVVDGLPDGYPTGLRVYGADKSSGCDDTRLAVPVTELDRGKIKQAVADVKPKGDTPIGLSLQKAAEDLPKTAAGALGHRSILLVSDGEDSCGDPDPCAVAEQLGKQSFDLRIDTIGFQVRGKAKQELECIAEQGHGAYYDAPDAEALARQLQRSAELSAHGYRFKGKQIEAGLSAEDAADITPGQYLDSIGPGETKWYAAELDDAATADFGVTAVPQPGVKVAYSDGISMKLTATDEYSTQCYATEDTFGQDEGARNLTNAVSRIPSAGGGETCDAAGRYLLTVSRTSDPASDQSRWPLELAFSLEKPLKKSVTPAQSETEYGAAGQDAALPTSTPKDTEGGTGFNDAKELKTGVWKDTLLPAQTRYYKLPVGWGQQLRYRVEFANEPQLESGSGVSTFVDANTYSPSRTYVSDGPFESAPSYYGEPVTSDFGTVPVSWTNRWESGGEAVPMRGKGDYYISVTLGPNAAQFAENAAIGIVLRVDVMGKAKAGPQHNAPVIQAKEPAAGKNATRADGGSDSGSALPLIAAGAGGALLIGAVVAYLIVRNRRTAAANGMTRGGV